MFDQPKGLYVLFFAELWERFSYYGMRAILVLYLTSTIHGGLGWDSTQALALYGTYTMSVYVAGIPGGLLADRLIGQKKAVMLGGFLLCLGHLILAIPNMTAFYSALTLIVLGVGCLKPNISTLVGGLYRPGDPARDGGFTFFYMGINVGALLAPITVALVAKTWGWHYGFALAGIGMLVGQAVFIWGQKFLVGIGDFVPAPKNAAGLSAEKPPLTKVEKDRILVLLLSFIVVIVFWGAYEQGGGLLNLYTDAKVDRIIFGYELPAGAFQSIKPFFVLLFANLVAMLWNDRAKRGQEVSALFKMAIGCMTLSLGFMLIYVGSHYVVVDDAGQVLEKMPLFFLVGTYAFLVLGELSLSPVSLSFITKLAPLRVSALMMGAYFAMTGFGSKLAGMLGQLAKSLGEQNVFLLVFGLSLGFGLLLLSLLRPLKRLTHGAEEVSEDPHKNEG